MTEEEAKTKCSKKGCNKLSVAHIDGENLCHDHADQWVRNQQGNDQYDADLAYEYDAE